MTTEIELAWAAGFFDGEGTAGLCLTYPPAHELRVQLKQNARPDGSVPDTLVRFHLAVGRGRIGGPYMDRPTRSGFSENRRPAYMWYARRDEAIAVLRVLWPHLGEAKRSAAAQFVTMEVAA